MKIKTVLIVLLAIAGTLGGTVAATQLVVKHNHIKDNIHHELSAPANWRNTERR